MKIQEWLECAHDNLIEAEPNVAYSNVGYRLLEAMDMLGRIDTLVKQMDKEAFKQPAALAKWADAFKEELNGD